MIPAEEIKSPALLASTGEPSRKTLLLSRYFKFCAVGGSGLLVDMAIFYCLLSQNVFGITVSKMIAAEVAIINNFVWNRVWTFKDTKRPESLRQILFSLMRFNVICVFGVGLSILLIHSQIKLIEMSPHIANFIAIVCVSVWNFALSSRYGFRKS